MNADINRRLENLIRIGRIKTITPAKPFTTVTVNLGEIMTAELRYLNLRAGTDQTWDPPSIGEEVLVLSPSGELALGVAIAGLNNEFFPTPSDELNKKLRLYEDGCFICYDVKTHVLEALLPEGGKAVLTASGGITLNGDTTINGNVNILGTTHASKKISTDDNIDAAKNISATGGMTAKGNIQSQGDISATGDIKAGDISLITHKTSGVQPGDGNSGVPIP